MESRITTSDNYALDFAACYQNEKYKHPISTMRNDIPLGIDATGGRHLRKDTEQMIERRPAVNQWSHVLGLPR